MNESMANAKHVPLIQLDRLSCVCIAKATSLATDEKALPEWCSARPFWRNTIVLGCKPLLRPAWLLQRPFILCMPLMWAFFFLLSASYWSGKYSSFLANQFAAEDGLFRSAPVLVIGTEMKEYFWQSLRHLDYKVVFQRSRICWIKRVNFQTSLLVFARRRNIRPASSAISEKFWFHFSGQIIANGNVM